MGITFGSPNILWLLLTIPVILWLYYLYRKEKKKAAIKFSSLGIIKESSEKKVILRQHLPFALLLL